MKINRSRKRFDFFPEDTIIKKFTDTNKRIAKEMVEELTIGDLVKIACIVDKAYSTSGDRKKYVSKKKLCNPLLGFYVGYTRVFIGEIKESLFDTLDYGVDRYLIPEDSLPVARIRFHACENEVLVLFEDITLPWKNLSTI